MSDRDAYTKAARQHRSLGEIVEEYRAWKNLKAELAAPQDAR